MTSDSHRSLSRVTLTGLIWFMGQTVIARLSGLISQLFLARLLIPEDFAVLALAVTATAIIGVLQDFGVEDILVQRSRRMAYWSTPALFVGLPLGLMSMAVVMILAPWAARLYHSPQVAPMLYIMSVNMPLVAIATVPVAALRHSMRFGFLAAYNSSELILVQVATVLLAYFGLGAFAFAIPGPLAAAVRVIVFWRASRPKFHRLRRRQLRIMASQGGVLFASKLTHALVNQGDYFILGLVATKAELGAYYFSFRIAFQPVAALAGNFQAILFPALSKFSHQPELQRDLAIEASEILAYLIMPIGWMIAALAPHLFPLVFGHKWDAAIPLTQILSIALAFDAIAWVAGALLNTRGEFTRAFQTAFFLAPVFFVAVGAGALAGSAYGAAWGVMVYYVIGGPVYYHVTFRRLGVSIGKILSICFVPAILCAATIGIVALLAPRAGLSPLPTAIAVGFLGGGGYLLALALTAREVFVKIMARFRSAISR